MRYKAQRPDRHQFYEDLRAFVEAKEFAHETDLHNALLAFGEQRGVKLTIGLENGRLRVHDRTGVVILYIQPSTETVPA